MAVNNKKHKSPLSSSDDVARSEPDVVIKAKNPLGPTRKTRRGIAFGALFVTVMLAIVVTAIVNNATRPDSATIVKVSAPHLATVKITDQGFNPAALTINRGTVVIWQGTQSTGPVIIAANPYPNDSSLKSLKSTQVGNGTNYRYRFTSPGTFKYHNELNPSVNGIVIVN